MARRVANRFRNAMRGRCASSARAGRTGLPCVRARARTVAWGFSAWRGLRRAALPAPGPGGGWCGWPLVNCASCLPPRAGFGRFASSSGWVCCRRW